MRVIVTHGSPDWDAITSVWLLKRFVPEWKDAKVVFVAAGLRYKNQKLETVGEAGDNPIEQIDGNQVIHVDTGLGPLDHHQTNSEQISAAKLTWDYVCSENMVFLQDNKSVKQQSIDRIVAVVVSIDHFKEVFWADPTADYHEMSFLGILDGYKLQHPNKNMLTTKFGMQILDAMVHTFENRIWAEQEIEKNGKIFQTKWGKGIGFETINDEVLVLAQKKGYIIVVRKDPRKGYVRIKARPSDSQKTGVDLTPVYDKLKGLDQNATWFLHVSKKMLLNGSSKNPNMRPSTLHLDEIIHVLEAV